MIEIPEAESLSRQLIETVGGKKITRVIAGLSPHKFAWYHGDPKDYDALLRGKTIDTAVARGGMVEVRVDGAMLLFSDGVVLRFHVRDEQRPRKHQLLVEFEDDTALSASVQMYGGLWCFKEGGFQNPYYDAARHKPSPLSDEFDGAYFGSLITHPDVQKLSVKAFLATEQRIPGLGNGVLQDILCNARVHPKRQIGTLTNGEREALFHSVKSTLAEMTAQGGRDTTRDLFGEPGGYITKLSQATIDRPCPVCGGTIVKQAYMGGSIYFCGGCQKM
ncbi:MAG TPA: endonuclease VIII [Dehalococcoidia bacterium]|nr:endonuclease VIII [Dehalococcoidia bacterium]